MEVVGGTSQMQPVRDWCVDMRKISYTHSVELASRINTINALAILVFEKTPNEIETLMEKAVIVAYSFPEQNKCWECPEKEAEVRGELDSIEKKLNDQYFVWVQEKMQTR